MNNIDFSLRLLQIVREIEAEKWESCTIEDLYQYILEEKEDEEKEAWIQHYCKGE